MYSATWYRDDRQTRVLTRATGNMKDVIDNKWWGLLLKVVLTITTIMAPILSKIMFDMTNVQNKHSTQIENITEWRRGHEDFSGSAIKRLEAVEKAVQERSIDVAVIKEQVRMINEALAKTSVQFQSMSEQMSRAQREFSDVQSRLEAVKNQIK